MTFTRALLVALLALACDGETVTDAGVDPRGDAGVELDSGPATEDAATEDAATEDAATDDAGAEGCPPASTLDPMALSRRTLRASGCAASTADTPCADHLLYEPASPASDRLWVMLPGTGMEPDKHSWIGQIAAHVGFRALLLSYDTSQNVNEFCQAEGTPTCHEAVRDLLLTGGERSAGGETYRVDPARSVVGRLLAVLRSEAWGADYLRRTPEGPTDVDAVDWSRVVVVGFSLGAGQAMRLTQRAPIAGALFIDGAKDPWERVGDTTRYADWPTQPILAPADALYGAYHVDGSDVEALVEQWRRLGVTDVRADVDAAAIPPDARVLFTAQTPPSGVTPHLSMARSADMPADVDGTRASGATDVHLYAAYSSVFCALR